MLENTNNKRFFFLVPGIFTRIKGAFPLAYYSRIDIISNLFDTVDDVTDDGHGITEAAEAEDLAPGHTHEGVGDTLSNANLTADDGAEGHAVLDHADDRLEGEAKTGVLEVPLVLDIFDGGDGLDLGEEGTLLHDDGDVPLGGGGPFLF